MPSAIETLVKILKLEREQGCKNNAVIGGLSAYGNNWRGQAFSQARRAEHMMLVDEIADLLKRYDQLETKDERDSAIRYILDRVTGRQPAPAEYQNRTYVVEPKPDAPPNNPPSRAREERRPPREPRPQGEQRPPREDARPNDERRQRGGRDEQRRPRQPNAEGEMQAGETVANEAAQDMRPPRPLREKRPLREDRPPRIQKDPDAGGAPRVPWVQPQGTNEPGTVDAPGDESFEGTPSVGVTDAALAAAQQFNERGQKRKDKPKQKNKQQERPQPFARPPGRPQGQSSDEGEGGERREFSGLDMDSDFAVGNRAPKMDIPVQPKLERPPRAPRKPIDPDEAADIERGLGAPVERVKGVGPKMARLLNKLDIYTIEDMLFFKPRRYDDYTQLSYLSKLTEKQNATVIGTVQKAEIRIGRSGRRDFFALLDDGTAKIGITWFGQHFLNRQIREGQQIVVRGVTSKYGNRIQIDSPQWEPLDVDNLKAVGIVPVYPLTAELNGRVLRRLIKQAVDYWAERLPDPMPEAVLERAELADIGWALKNLHFPESWDHLKHAKRRLIFDELLKLQLAILNNRRMWQSTPGQSLMVDDDRFEAMLNALFPFPLTGAQRRSIENIRGDVAQPIPMNRLLQGDVGSGKTAVAIAAVGLAVLNGKQAAVMSPTGILAEQLHRNFSRALAQLASLFATEENPEGRIPRVALLTGSITSADREAVYAGLADGSIDVVVGTHAIIQEGVEFNDLAVAVIDEQHRFGVEQRGKLRGKGTNPHLLVMTATPIPRTLALTMYADLDLSVIDEMPPGRIPIRTRVIEPPEREKAYNFIEAQLQKGRQAFIVYPLVEDSEVIEAESAVSGHEKLQKIFYQHKLGLLHGKMRPDEKDQIMNEFREGKFDVLVTTSVAEVGVDIPNASVILIEGANRFGLAQLHQFRGRVGRGGHASFCYLMCDMPVPEAKMRLTALEQTSDGFKLAEIDWQIRGAGDLIGTRQSGRAAQKLLDDMTPDLVETAQREARAIYAEDPELQSETYRTLRESIALLLDDRSDMS
jgi:ATP-dependent DNA helicase RecG